MQAAPPPVVRHRPRVLLPQAGGEPGPIAIGPAGIPSDRLSPRALQGEPGRFEGQLARAGAVFFTPGRVRLVALDRSGRAVTIAYVLGDDAQLGRLIGQRLAVEGPVYWFRSSRYPAILAERIHRLP